jgi:hypothetical protein
MVDPHGGRVNVESSWHGIKIFFFFNFIYFLSLLTVFLLLQILPEKLLEPGNRVN